MPGDVPLMCPVTVLLQRSARDETDGAGKTGPDKAPAASRREKCLQRFRCLQVDLTPHVPLLHLDTRNPPMHHRRTARYHPPGKTRPGVKKDAVAGASPRRELLSQRRAIQTVRRQTRLPRPSVHRLQKAKRPQTGGGGNGGRQQSPEHPIRRACLEAMAPIPIKPLRKTDTSNLVIRRRRIHQSSWSGVVIQARQAAADVITMGNGRAMACGGGPSQMPGIHRFMRRLILGPTIAVC